MTKQRILLIVAVALAIIATLGSVEYAAAVVAKYVEYTATLVGKYVNLYKVRFVTRFSWQYATFVSIGVLLFTVLFIGARLQKARVFELAVRPVRKEETELFQMARDGARFSYEEIHLRCRISEPERAAIVARSNVVEAMLPKKQRPRPGWFTGFIASPVTL